MDGCIPKKCRHQGRNRRTLFRPNWPQTLKRCRWGTTRCTKKKGQAHTQKKARGTAACQNTRFFFPWAPQGRAQSTSQTASAADQTKTHRARGCPAVSQRPHRNKTKRFPKPCGPSSLGTPMLLDTNPGPFIAPHGEVTAPPRLISGHSTVCQRAPDKDTQGNSTPQRTATRESGPSQSERMHKVRCSIGWNIGMYNTA